MTHLLIIALICIGFSQNIYSDDANKADSGCINIDSNRKYLHYKLGYFYDIYIAEGDNICEVLFYDNRSKKCISTSCQKSPILKWAFKKMGNEIKDTPFTITDEYSPLYYHLTLENDSSEIIISSSKAIFKYSDDVKAKIESLKALLVELWISNCLQPSEISDH